MDIALTLKTYQDECDRIYAAIESYMAYVDLIDTSYEEDLYGIYDAFEADGNKPAENSADAATKVEQSKEAKKKNGFVAMVKSIGEAVMNFFKSLFGIGKVKEIPKSITLAWPKGIDKPDKIYDRMDKDFNEIMIAIKNGKDPAEIDQMLKAFSDNSNELLKDIKDQQAKMKATKNTNINGKKTIGSWISAHFNPASRAAHINKSIKKFNQASDKEIKSIRKYQEMTMKLSALIKNCEIAQTDTRNIIEKAEQIANKGEKKIAKQAYKAGKDTHRLEDESRAVAKKDHKYNKKKYDIDQD